MATLSLKQCLWAAILVTVSSWVNAGTTVIKFDEDKISGNLTSWWHGSAIHDRYTETDVKVNKSNKSLLSHLSKSHNGHADASKHNHKNDLDDHTKGSSAGKRNDYAKTVKDSSKNKYQKNTSNCGHGKCDKRDNQGGHHKDKLAGYVTFGLDIEVKAVGFEHNDFQANLDANEGKESFGLQFKNAMKLQSIKFSDFINADNGAMLGDKSTKQHFTRASTGNKIPNSNNMKYEIADSGTKNSSKFTSANTTKVPEPGTLALFGLSLLGMLRINRIQ